jgi:hypothetical protein
MTTTQPNQAPFVERDMIPTALERNTSMPIGYEPALFKLERNYGVCEDSPSDEFLTYRAALEEKISIFEQKQDLCRREEDLCRREQDLCRREEDMLWEKQLKEKEAAAEKEAREDWLEIEQQAALYNPAAGAENSEEVKLAFDLVCEKKLKEQWAFMEAKYKAMGITL